MASPELLLAAVLYKLAYYPTSDRAPDVRRNRRIVETVLTALRASMRDGSLVFLDAPTRARLLADGAVTAVGLATAKRRRELFYSTRSRTFYRAPV